MAQNDPLKCQDWLKFRLKISISEVIHRPLELTIHPNVGLLSPKTMSKHFLNNSRTTLKKSQKCPKNTPHHHHHPPPLTQPALRALLFRATARPQRREEGCHILSFWAENKPESGPFKANYNAQTLPEQLPYHYWKFQKTGFLTPN